MVTRTPKIFTLMSHEDFEIYKRRVTVKHCIHAVGELTKGLPDHMYDWRECVALRFECSSPQRLERWEEVY